MIFTNDRARELDNRLLWVSTENRKQIEVCELDELTSFLLIFFIYCSQIDRGHS